MEFNELGSGIAIALVAAIALNSRMFVDPVVDFLEWVIEGISYLIGAFMTVAVEQLLILPPPGEIPELVSLYWGTSITVFIGLLLVSGSAFFASMQFFPSANTADPERFLRRCFIGIVAVIAMSSGFDLIIESVNLLVEITLPDDFQITIPVSELEAIGTIAFSSIAALIFPIIASPQLFVTISTFFVILGMRAVIVYTLYALFPILIGLWIVDHGPMKYANKFSLSIIKIATIFLLFGVVIGITFGVGGAIAGGPSEAVQNPPDTDIQNGSTTGDRTEGGVFSDDSPPTRDGATATTDGTAPVTASLLRVFTFFATQYLSIAVVGMFFSSTISTGFTRQLKRQKFVMGKARNIKSRLSDSTDKAKDAAEDATEGATDQAADQIQDQMSEAAKPPENASTIRDTLGDIAGTAMKAKQRGKEQIEQAQERVSDEINQLEDDALATGKQANDQIQGRLDDGPLGTVAGKSAELGIRGGSKLPHAAIKGGELTIRGGKAYTQVFKQRGVAPSLAESLNIAQRSPIGRPTSVTPDDVSESIIVEDEDVDLDTVKDNEDAFDDARINTKNLQYIPEQSKKTDDIGIHENHPIQRGKLVDQESGEAIPYIGFDLDEDGVEPLQPGNTYDFEMAGTRKWNENKAFAHPSEFGNYMQIKSDEHTTINKTGEADLEKGQKTAYNQFEE